MHYIIGRFAKVHGASNVECDFLNSTQELGKNSMCGKSIALTKEQEEWSAGQWAAGYFMPLGAMAGAQMGGCFYAQLHRLSRYAREIHQGRHELNMQITRADFGLLFK